jgi:hypothetical protein
MVRVELTVTHRLLSLDARRRRRRRRRNRLAC